MISIITINYNNKIGLENTIKSVINQTYKNFEYIVIDGDSTDGSKQIIKLYKHYFKYAVSEPDNGIYNAMNKGIKVAKGEYLIFLNSGDTFFNYEVLNKVTTFISTDFQIYYGNLVYEEKGDSIVKKFPDKLSFSYFYKNSLPHPATFIKKSLFDEIFLYNESFKIVSDWEFFICAICKYNISYRYIDLNISIFDLKGISCNPLNKELIAKERETVLNDMFPMYVRDMNDLNNLNQTLETNRFKLLKALEKSIITKKIISGFLRILLFVFQGKTLKDL
ncbi:glycosyltransferase family 2 protein [uncultured Lutibacter sp.]|uniref:glycosyltransferase family 2 protein n=1 Tax=uncultured Lutibacter sp. TaxID=437739 RepID=UPI00263422C2|nr:glycosyltransferase family 2 protein [uncultured Lutibacter sp.]